MFIDLQCSFLIDINKAKVITEMDRVRLQVVEIIFHSLSTTCSLEVHSIFDELSYLDSNCEVQVRI